MDIIINKPIPFRDVFTKCTNEGLTSKSEFLTFHDHPDLIPAFPTEKMLTEINSGKLNGMDRILCGKFGGFCSSKHSECMKMRGL